MNHDPNCIFCKIIEKQIPSKLEHEDDLSVVFHDINPKAKTHLLLVPKKNIATIKDLEEGDEKVMGHLIKMANQMGKKFSLENYRLQFNVGKGAGQEVFHIHLHLLSSP